MENSSLNSPSLQYIVDCYCSHIQHPFTLEEIVQKIESGDYNAELLLQHLLVWAHKETDLRAEPNHDGTIAARLNFWKVRCDNNRYAEILHDGYAVYAALTDDAKRYTTPENVSAVLNAFKSALANASGSATLGGGQ